MYLVFSLAGLALAAGMLTFFVLWRRARKARDKAFHALELCRKSNRELRDDVRYAIDNRKEWQDIAATFEETAKDFEERLADMTQERNRWKNAAEASRSNAMLEVRNLFAYNGTDAGQEELTHDA